jgi:FHA domain
MGEEGSPKTEMINPALLDGVSANFIVKGPSGVEKSYPMRQLVMTIGRSDQCDISVKDGSMSGRHCEVSKINGEIRVKDLGSANGIWLNGERITDAELFDGDVIRLGQTSVRVDVVGGKKRPDAGMNPKMLAALIGGFVLILAIGIGTVVLLKKKAQKKADTAAAVKFVELARKNQEAKPCSAVVDKVQDIARTMNGLPKGTCAAPPKGEEARRMVAGYKDLAHSYELVAKALGEQFGKNLEAETTGLQGFTDAVVDAGLKGKLEEAREVIEKRHAVTTNFISDWKKASQATNTYSVQADMAFNQGNKNACTQVDKGVQAKSPVDILQSCSKAFDAARKDVDEALKVLEESVGGGEAAGE